MFVKQERLPKIDVVPVFKKSNREKLEAFHAISLLPVSRKIIKKLLYKSTFKYSTDINFIWHNHSGVLLLTYQIYKSFDDNQEVLSVFLHIFKSVCSVCPNIFFQEFQKTNFYKYFVQTVRFGTKNLEEFFLIASPVKILRAFL